jgi:hypothetical protein
MWSLRVALVPVLICMALLVASYSSDESATGVTIQGLAGSDGQDVVITRSADMPPQLAACLGDETVLAKLDYEQRCVMPYINGLWVDPQGLLRPHESLASAAKDWRLERPADGRWPIFHPNGLKPAKNDREQMLAKDKNLAEQVVLKDLSNPQPIPSVNPNSIYYQAGLMYLPNSYVVPGGIFNRQRSDQNHREPDALAAYKVHTGTVLANCTKNARQAAPRTNR